MNKDQVRGRMEKAKGKMKDVAGKATANEDLRAEGKVDKVSGKVRSEYGDAKENVKDKIDKM